MGFCLNREEIQLQNIGHGLEIGLITHTIVEPFIKPIQFPPFPKFLMPFHEVYEQPHKSFVGNDPCFHMVYNILLMADV